MGTLPAMLLSVSTWLVPLGLGAFVVHTFVRRRGLVSRRATSAPSLRVPGHSLVQQIVDEVFNVAGWVIACGISIGMPVSVTAMQSALTGGPSNWVLAVAVGIGALVLCLRALTRSLTRLTNLRTGLAAEIETGHQVAQLMKQGYEVFHDIPAEGFNIDHIVVGPTGVFAIETKGRRKPTPKGKVEYRVTYRDGALHWPNWEDRASPDQARRQAKWASQWLTHATGAPVVVEPVLCIPGWYVELKSKPPFPIWGSRGIDLAILKSPSRPLSQQQIQQITYQVEQRALTRAGPTSSPDADGQPLALAPAPMSTRGRR